LLPQTLDDLPAELERPKPTQDQPQGICLDKGYDYPEVEQVLVEAQLTPHIRRRGESAKPLRPGAKARRWVVERTHSWMNRFRRILVRWEKRDDTYLAMLHLACAVICYRALGLLG
jgi:putative transposase